MNAGKMRHRITVTEVLDASKDATGLTGTVTNGITLWAQVIPMNQARGLYYGIPENYRSYEIRTRSQTEITTLNGLVWGTKTLTIHSSMPDAREHELKIIAYERD